jgi:hypothetical protein
MILKSVCWNMPDKANRIAGRGNGLGAVAECTRQMRGNPTCRNRAPLHIGAPRAILGTNGIVDARNRGGMIGSYAPLRRRAPALMLVAIFLALNALIASVLIGPTPSALLHGDGEPNQTSIDHSLARVPDLIAGHTGWCAYDGPSAGGACARVAPPLSTEPADARHAACGFQPIHFAGLTAHWGEAVTTLPARTAPAGALLSCASSWYAIRGDVLLAAILLDARNSSVSAPAPPRLRPLHGGHGIFTVAASELAMRRIRKGWLVVQGGTLSQRLSLLRRLHTTEP